MGHYCRICGRSRPNERFSGRGHRIHICKECQRLPAGEIDRIERREELHGFLLQSAISPKNLARLKVLTGHADREVAETAALILEVGRVLPGKRSRWLKLAQRHRPLFDQAVAYFGIEFFEDMLYGNGDSESPLWDILEEFRSDNDGGVAGTGKEGFIRRFSRLQMRENWLVGEIRPIGSQPNSTNSAF